MLRINQDNIVSKNNAEIKDIINDHSHQFVFQCDPINTVIDTENGLRPARTPRNQVKNFKRLIKGNQSLFLNISGGTELIPHDE